jgi:hypothetical protein
LHGGEVSKFSPRGARPFCPGVCSLASFAGWG